MVGHQVPAAFLAVLPLTNLGLLKHRDILGARSYTHCPPASRDLKRLLDRRTTNDKNCNDSNPWPPLTGNFHIYCSAKTPAFVGRLEIVEFRITPIGD